MIISDLKNCRILADRLSSFKVKNTSANVINVELIPDKLYLNKETFPWEKICITSDPSVVQGLKRVGDVSDKFAHHGDSPTMYEYKMQLCLNRIKKKAAKMGGTIVLTKSPKSGKYIKIRATAYK